MLGLIASIIFIVGLLSFMSGPSEKKNYVAEDPSAWKLPDHESIGFKYSENAQIELETGLLSKRYLQIIYGTVKATDALLPIKAWSAYEGFMAGTDWKPSSIVITNGSNPKEVSYEVHGIFEWKLFNVPIYSEAKVYKGRAILQPSK